MRDPSDATSQGQSGGSPDMTQRGQPEVPVAKAALRIAILQLLKQISPEDRARDSFMACARLALSVEWTRARTILVYAPMAGEVDIAPAVQSALHAGKTITLPRYDSEARIYRAYQIGCALEELPLGRFGIREPGQGCPTVSMNQLDFVLVPGVAFDGSGRRLGRGRGYYDRLLTGVRAVKCGVAFDLQVRGQIPVEPHDILLDCILTPTRWLDVRRIGDDFTG